MSRFTPSHYQAKILTWVSSGTGCAVVTAVAGSGKTTTLVEAARRSGGEGLFLAFNKAIVSELAPRLRGTGFGVQTCHSAGFAVLRHARAGSRVDSSKYRAKIREISQAACTALRLNKKGARYQLECQIRGLFDLARATLQTDADPREVCRSRGVEMDAAVLTYLAQQRVLARLAEWGVSAFEESGALDFGDMLWLPIALDLPAPRRYAWIFVDECQDLSAAQRALVHRLRDEDGRVLFVGDRDQAIYGFAGADCASVDEIVEEFGAVELPLSICYRCPTAVLDLAREIVPSVEARDGAPEGAVREIYSSELYTHVRPGDLVLCRLTAPLVSTCLRLLRRRVPAIVRGRAIGSQLAAFMGAASDHVVGRWERAAEGILMERSVRLRTARRLPEERVEAAIAAAEDIYEAVVALLEGWQGEGWDAFIRDTQALFSDDDGRGQVVLSTVHRAKGLEADRVFILRPEKLPLKWRGQTREQRGQEWNLKYVALTRARKELVFVVEPSEEDDRLNHEDAVRGRTEADNPAGEHLS